MAAVTNFYRRTLPSPPAIEFASSEGKKLFSEALLEGHMEGFFQLISYYQTQSEPAYCGLATLAVVLNALAIDPGRKWKGPWRWFDDTMLDCCVPLEKVKDNGISFSKAACLAYCNGAEVEAFHANESNINNFRNYVISCSSSENYHMIVSYHRSYLKQTGSGHFSPIGGYHARKDMVLILDVARFKYPPHWVPLTLLWDALNTLDEATGLYRGFMLLSRLQKAPSILYTLDTLSVIFTAAPTNLRYFINWIAEVRNLEDGSNFVSEEEWGRLHIKEEVLKQVRGTELFKHITSWLLSVSSCVENAIPDGHDSLDKFAFEVCCQRAQFLCGKVGSSNSSCSKLKQLRSSNCDNGESVTEVSGKLIVGDSESGLEMLVPCCKIQTGSSCDNFISEHPLVADALTVLILALPPDTWNSLRDAKLQEEFSGLVSTNNLTKLLQQEVLHLRKQLHLLVADICSSWT